MSFSWQCPFCNHMATISEKNSETNRLDFDFGNKYGRQALIINFISCPNPNCREYCIRLSLHNTKLDKVRGAFDILEAKNTWKLIPSSEMKIFPDYIPKSIISDYEEACKIVHLSPKASATLSRRCLQGMIRDFWKISKNRLVEEINALQEKIDPVTWKAIDTVRKIGNIGAHMEKDINLILDVEPNEAKLLIGLIETLIKEWYIAKHDREENMAAIIALADDKGKN